ncbi:Phosphatidylserine synthase 2 [Orchesella cincta]|uniref:Phosphatidylserine synthase n=1 Tax=Orchesella cincta TaxID=48709 RepID=A0A1D2M4A6_ORCCI|nr:Phosphatidylserine synthase 2 [Orchesella cincta]
MSSSNGPTNVGGVPSPSKEMIQPSGSNGDDKLVVLSAQVSKDVITQTDTETESELHDHEVSSITGGPYDWRKEKKGAGGRFTDDGTVTFFWRAPHIDRVGLVDWSAGLRRIRRKSSEYNAKRGLIAVVSVFILLGVTITPDGPFLRPHPAFWRFIFILSILYELALIFLLFQNANDARLLLRHVDPKLGTLLEEKSYGGNCFIYDPTAPGDPWHNVVDKFDLFVPLHFFGWWLKTLVLRDWWLSWVISVMFEILEYTLEHQLPNFSECWWDHWILDALVCNGGGILLGMLTLKYFRVRTYEWRGLWNIPDYTGKIKRVLAQFGPHSWIEFDWKPTSSFGRWMAVLGITFVFLVAELNTFYLKFVLWVPPGHFMNLVRLFALLFWGAVGLRETFQYLDDSECKTFGRQSWIIIAIVSTEFLIVAKVDPVTITKPLPNHIATFWVVGLGVLALWTVWNFFISRFLFEELGPDVSEEKFSRRRRRRRIAMFLLNNRPILSKPQLKKLKEHKYSASSASLLDPLFQHWWNWVVKQLPLWLAPNLITISGLIVNVLTSLIVIYYSPDCQQEVPGWACYLCALGLFVYQSLDAIDGKQARRTNSSSPLGELFDHGCDSISTVFVSLAVCASVQLGSAPKLLFLQCFSAILLYYCAHWQTYVSGTLKFGVIDVTEAQIGIVILHMVSGYFGSSFWSQSLLSDWNVPRCYLVSAVAMVAALPALVGNFHTILYKQGAGKNGSSIAGTSVISPIVPFSLVLFPAMMLAGNVYTSHPVMYIATFGLIAAKVTNRLVVAHMTKSGMDWLDSSLFGPFLMFVNQCFNTPLPEDILLFFSLAWACIDLGLYCGKVCIQICNSLDIHLFRISTGSVPAAQKLGKKYSI